MCKTMFLHFVPVNGVEYFSGVLGRERCDFMFLCFQKTSLWTCLDLQLVDKSLLHYEKLWYLFYRYLRVSPGTVRKCMLHDSVSYRNTRSIDPITLLSMVIVVETFLEIVVSDLLVST
jgi:hypothetical protein